MLNPSVLFESMSMSAPSLSVIWMIAIHIAERSEQLLPLTLVAQRTARYSAFSSCPPA
jgi:hypothetical protein